MTDMHRSHLPLAIGLCAISVLGCQHGSVHPIPEGNVHGLVPLPRLVEPLEEAHGRGFRCEGKLSVYIPEGWDMSAATEWLEEAGIGRVSADSSHAQVAWIPTSDALGDEGYRLTVRRDRIRMECGDATAAFRAWTTLRQLMPQVCEQGCPQGFTLPGVSIEDNAELEHRGLLLDCCRHFMEPEFVKEVIEALALQKMNVLHWHLTEDQGWRLPIAAYPKLTQIGGFRTEASGQISGGFYTREQILDIVDFAQKRHVKVIPEIEMPGHCRAALAAYPWLGCTGDTLPVPSNWGVFKDVYCAGSDTTMSFMKAVLDEVCALFPSDIIHIGGDEVPKVRWANCSRCQAKMKKLGLTSEAELQTAFINEMGAHVAQHGKRIMGWDEILEGGLPDGAVVQSWRGMKGAIEATHLGTDAVVSPTSHCYLDYPLRSTDLEEVYHFEAVPKEAQGHEGRIVGGECNMWTERAPQDQVMGKVFPRATGMAEVLWSGRDVTGAAGAYEGFLSRLDGLAQRWSFMGLEPGLEGVPVELELSPSHRGSIEAKVVPAIRNAGGTVRFVAANGASTDSSIGVRVGEALQISERGEVEVDVVIRGRSTGVTERFPVAGHMGVHQPLELHYTPSKHYTGGGLQALADGRRGSMDFRDGAWQAAQGQDMTCVLDLGMRVPISAMETQLYLYQDAWIFLPKSVEWAWSNDRKSFEALPGLSPWGSSLEPDARQTVVPVRMDGLDIEARYVKMTLRNAGPCPDWHDAATEPSWIFVDELVVESTPGGSLQD